MVGVGGSGTRQSDRGEVGRTCGEGSMLDIFMERKGLLGLSEGDVVSGTHHAGRGL